MRPATRRVCTALLACLLVAASSARLFAQAGAVWFAAGIATRGASQVATDFDPPRLSGLDGRGRGTQRVDASGKASPVFEAGAQWFPASRAGIEIWVARDRGDEQATSSPYSTTLTYISRQPPDHVPREFRYERSADWPPVRTEIRRWMVGFNGALRPVSSPRVAWIVSGGLAWVRLSGVIEPLGFTTFVLGGHSVLFPNEYRLTAELEPASAWRANAGTMLDVRLASHLAFTTGVRFVAGADRDLRLRVAGVDRSQAGFEPPPDDEIDEALAGSTARVSTRSFRALAGLKVIF